MILLDGFIAFSRVKNKHHDKNVSEICENPKTLGRLDALFSNTLHILKGICQAVRHKDLVPSICAVRMRKF